MELLTSPEAWIALLTLTVLEIVLGIDNIIFIAIISEKVDKSKREVARKVGLFAAMFVRVLLLFCISWVMKLSEPIFTIFNLEISGRDLILILGGLFLLGKSTHEIHVNMEEPEHEQEHPTAGSASFSNVIVQIMLLDIVFSLDSVITAIGLADHVQIMIAAVVISIIFMMIFVNKISKFVEDHPTIKILALSFLILIGFSLVAEGIELHIPKGYIYFAMAFSVGIEMLNIKIRAKRKKLRTKIAAAQG